MCIASITIFSKHVYDFEFMYILKLLLYYFYTFAIEYCAISTEFIYNTLLYMDIAVI